MSASSEGPSAVDTLVASSVANANEEDADSRAGPVINPPAKTSNDEVEKGPGSIALTEAVAQENDHTEAKMHANAETAEGKDAASKKKAAAKSAEDAPPPKPPGSNRGETEPAAEYLKRMWAPEVERASMQDWRRIEGQNLQQQPEGYNLLWQIKGHKLPWQNEWQNLRWPLPIIQAFYLQKPDTVAKTSNAEDCKSENTTVPTEVLEDPGTLKNLQRIAINSEYLYHELLSITCVYTMENHIIIGPPYKLLVHFSQDIQTRLAKLKQNVEDAKARVRTSAQEPFSDKLSGSWNGACQNESSQSASNQNSTQQMETRDKGPSIDSEADHADLAVARYVHLKILHDFIMEELGDVLRLRTRIIDGIQGSIRFEDLWHLYKPGDVIYSKENGYDQLYKVFFVTGGQSLKRSRTEDESIAIRNMRDRLSYWNLPELREEDDEEAIDKMLREEGSGIGTWTPFKVDCYLMGFNGEYCGPIAVCKKIWAYVGDREITSLPMYPLKFHPKGNELLRAMEERGRKFLFAVSTAIHRTPFLAKGGHKSYDGRTLAMKRYESKVEIQSDIYVDFDAYYQSNPKMKPTVGRLLRSKQNLAEEEEILAPGSTVQRSLSGHEVDSKLSDDFLTTNRLSLERFKPDENQISQDVLLLMPHYVIGYAFQVRQWYHLDIDLVKEIDRESANARAAGFDDLVIPKRYRDLLVALVDSHASGLQREKDKSKNASITKRFTQIDLVRGKGEGLIILLHGPPGSGKTSTAETIAAYTRRPLYSITCGDIGTWGGEVEKNLLEHTRRAGNWGCVLLLDEADVFLVQRDWSNVERNALTSIFLRQLEYYTGILFLTTNRPGVIDEAFKSRVHISLRYPSIDLESTKKMWSNIMNRLEQDNQTAELKVLFDKEVLLDFAQRHFDKCTREGVTWNGRQIRNAFQTALALGHYERLAKIREAGLTPEEAIETGKKKWRTVRLTKVNFASIAKTATEFEQYIETLRGSDSINAKEAEVRHDEFDPERPRARKQYPAAGGTREAVHRLHANVGASGMGTAKGKGKKAVRVEQPPSEEEEDEEDEDDEIEDLSGDDDDE